MGVIYDPHRNELFTAVKGQGAKMNGETIRVGEQEVIGDTIVAMGSPPGVESLEMSLKGVKVLMPKVRTIRMLGSAALMLAWVANGRLTCYWEYDLRYVRYFFAYFLAEIHALPTNIEQSVANINTQRTTLLLLLFQFMGHGSGIFTRDRSRGEVYRFRQ